MALEGMDLAGVVREVYESAICMGVKAMQALGMIDWARRLCREGSRVWQTSNSYLLWLGQAAFRCEGDSARETRRIDLIKALPDERRVFDVPTEDRLNALQALAEVAQRRLAAIWQGRVGGRLTTA